MVRRLRPGEELRSPEQLMEHQKDPCQAEQSYQTSSIKHFR